MSDDKDILDRDFTEPPHKWFSFAKLQDIMNNAEFLRNIRTGLVTTIVFGAPMLYFGFFGNLTWSAILNWELGGLAMLSIALVTAMKMDTKARAFEDEIKFNAALQKTEHDIAEESQKINDHLAGHRFVKRYNADQQKIADEREADYQIDVFKQAIAKMEIAGKEDTNRYRRFKRKLADVERLGAHGKYSPIVYDELYNAESKRARRNATAKEKLNYNPNKESIVGNIFSVATKGFVGGGAGSIPFLIGASFKTILIYYGTLFVTVLLTVVQTYLKVRFKTAKKYHAAREFKLSLLKECVLSIEEEKKKAAAAVVATSQKIADLEIDAVDVLPRLSVFDRQKPIQKQPS